MAHLEHCCVLSRGEFFISDWNSDCVGGLSEIICGSQPSPYIKVGNVSTAAVNISSQVLGKENKFNKLDEICSRVMIEGIDLSIEFNCASSYNLYQALFAEKKEPDSGTHTKDFCFSSLDEGMFFSFDKLGPQQTGLQVMLRDPIGNLVKMLVEGVDYVYSISGITLLQDIDPEDASTLRLYYNYDTNGFHEFDFLSKFIGYKSIYFKGANYNTDDHTQFDCEFHKVLFTPINSFDLISRDGFFTLALTASVEKQGDSWFRLIKQES